VSARAAVLYRLWSRDHVLLYVGVTSDLDRRLEEHRSDKAWWGDVDQTTTEEFRSMRLVLEAEARAIFWERPRHNVLGSARYSADWEAIAHELEDAEARRMALPDLTEDDYRFLAPTLNRMAELGMLEEAKRLYQILDVLHTRGRASS